MDLDLIKIDSTCFAGLALIYTAFQVRVNAKQRRAQYISDFIKWFWTDKDIVEAYYLFEYSEFEYTPGFHQSDLEKKIDRLLDCFGMLSKLHIAGLVPFEDICLMRYEFLTVYENEELARYFKFVDGWFKQRGIPHRPFDEFRSVCEILANERKNQKNAKTKKPSRR